MANKPKAKERRGFAAMDPDKQRSIARRGGKAAHLQGVGHEWTSEEARLAGRKGGKQAYLNRLRRAGQSA